MSDKPIFSYNLDDDEQHHIYENDLDDVSKPIADFIGASLRLKQTQEAYIDKIIDEKIKVLHELITSKRKGVEDVTS